MNRKDELRNIINTAQDELLKLFAEERSRENVQMAGRCFKYTNSHGDLDDTWLMYIKVVGLDDDGKLLAWTFQQSSFGTVVIGIDDFFSPFKGIEEISADEFRAAWLVLLSKLQEYGDKNDR